MLFKINNTTIKISFSFIALILLFFVSDKREVLFNTLLCAFLHELVHIIFLFGFSGKISYVSLSFLGADIKRSSQFVLSNIKEAVICISAPIFNLLMCFVTVLIFGEMNAFSKANFTLGFINILPFYTSDGGCFIKYILLTKYSEDVTEKRVTVISILTAIVFTVISVSACIVTKKISASILFCLYMVLSLVFKK